MSETVRYTEPKLCHYNYDLSKDWFVYFRITNVVTNETVVKQCRGARLNANKKLKDRIASGNALVKVWEQQLKEGWNPFDLPTEAEDLMRMNFKEALEFALKDCKVAKATYRAYSLCIKYILTASKGSMIQYTSIQKIKKTHIKLLLQKASKEYKWSNNSYNKNHGYLCAVLGRLVDWEIIEHNPAEKINHLPVTETKKFIAYTPEEKEKIREYFFLNHYRYYVILMFIYHGGLRPKEILALKIKHVNLYQRKIFIYPEIELENSKTKSIREVPVNNHLLPFLRELQLENYDPEYYVFGSPFEKGKGNRGAGSKDGKTGAMHPDYFKPSLVMIKRDTITKFWKKIVIDKLKINKYQYAAKHTGGDDKILAGMSLDALKELYGQHSKYMTEKYVSVLKEVYHKHIIEHSPAF